MPRPDFSEYVAHFTKDADPIATKEHGDDASLKGIKGSAKDKLISILQAKKIAATPMPWTGRHAVAFTECPWGSLLDHTKQYSAYGLGFKKSHLFAAGGGPAIYLRPHLHESQKLKGFDSELYAFITPFIPPYAPATYRNKHWNGKKPIDYSHEREWRVPHDFTFLLPQVAFVIVPNYDVVAKFPAALKDGIGRNNFIMIENYSQIEKLWPVHIL